MSIGKLRWVLALGIVALVGIIATQAYWVSLSWSQNEEDFDKKARLALYRVAQSLAEINHGILPPRDIVRRRSNNYYVVNTETEIDAQTLEYLLRRELDRLAINADFEYAIFDCYTEEMVYGGYCTYEPDKPPPDRPAAGIQMEPEEDFTYYFGVKFPNRSGHIWGEMQAVVFLSLLLLLVLGFFAYAISVIMQQRRLSELQKDFINNMTHEFKTPLATIRIAVDVLRRDPTLLRDARLLRYAGIIHDQYERLNSQVEKVLQLARIEQGKFELRREVLDLRRSLAPLVSATQLRVDEVGGRLEYRLPPEGLRVYADPLHLSNILHSLLDNAIKYGQRDGDLLLTLDYQLNNRQEILLCIRDHGPGIPVEMRERIFEKFYRKPTGDRHDVKGFGLGLFYVHSICRAHGWTISAQEPADGGAGVQFELRLPLTSAPTSQLQTSTP